MTVPYTFANASGNVPASELDANFAFVANNVSTANIVVFSAQPHITSVGNLTSLVVSGTVTGNRFSGNGNALTNIPGANVVGAVAYATTANSVAGANVVGAVAYATTANSVAGANVVGAVGLANVANTANAVDGANVSGQVGNALIAATVYTNSQPNITSVGILSNVSVTGNVTARDFYGISINSNTGNLLVSANVTNPELNWTFINDYSGTGIASLLGPVAGYNQRGELLLSGRYSTGTVTFTGPDYTAFPDSMVIAAGANISIAQTPGGLGNTATYVTTFDEAGNWTMPANVDVAENITGGNLLTGGDLSVTGNAIIAGNLSVTGNTITVNTEIVNVTESVTGNITGGNILTGGVVSATGNITGGNFNTAGLVTATGNVTGGNVLTGGVISATGNISTSANVLVSGYVSVTGNIDGGNIRTGNAIFATGNVRGGNISTAGLVTATGNVTAGNVLTGGRVSATGNITGANLSVGSGNVNVGNVVFALDSSKFNSAKWTLVETINTNLTYGPQVVTTTNSYNYYASNYNEVLYLCSAGGNGGTIVIPASAVTNNSQWAVNQSVGFKWANTANAKITVVDLSDPLTTVTVTMYAR